MNDDPNRACDQARLVRDLAPGETEDAVPLPNELRVAGAVVFECRMTRVGCVAVELYR